MNKYCYFLIFLFCILFSELYAQTFSHDTNSDISLPGDARGMCLKGNIIYVVAGKTIYKYDLHQKEGTTLISGLSTPFDVDVNNDGKIYIAERGQNRVSIYNADGSNTNETISLGEKVNGVTFGPDEKLYIASASKITIIDGNNKTEITQTEGVDNFREPRKVYFDQQKNTFIVDYNTGVLNILSFDGNVANVGFRIKRENNVDTYNRLVYMTSISNGNLIINSFTDTSMGVYEFYSDGTLKNKFEGEFSAPYGIVTDGNDNLYIADGKKIQVWKATDNEAPIISETKISNITRSSIDFSFKSNELSTLFWKIQSADSEPSEEELLNSSQLSVNSTNQIITQTLNAPTAQNLKLYFIARDKSGNTSDVQSSSVFSTEQNLTIKYLFPLTKNPQSITFEFSANDGGTLYYISKEYEDNISTPSVDEILNGTHIDYLKGGIPQTFDINISGNNRHIIYAIIKTSSGENSDIISCIATPYSDIDVIRNRYMQLLTGNDNTDYTNNATLNRYNSLLSRFNQAHTNAQQYDPNAEDLTDFNLDESAPTNDITLVRELFSNALFPLALAYNLKGPDDNPNPDYHNPSTLAEIMKLYEYLSLRNFKSGRELHFAGGGIYLRLTGYYYASLLMREELERSGRLDEVTGMMEWATRWVVPNSLEIEGGESDWSADSEGNTSRADGVRTMYNNRLMYVLTAADSVLQREEKMSYLIQVLNNALTPHGAWDGFLKPDYTGYHHLGVWGNGYVTEAMHVSAQMAFVLNNTSYSIDPVSIEHVAKGLQAFSQYSGKYDISRGLCGRFPNQLNNILNQIPAYAYIYEVLPEGKLKDEIAGIFANLYDPSYNLVQTKMIRNVACEINFIGGMGTIEMCNRLKASTTPTIETELNRTFPFAATQIHRRSDWLATVKGYSKYVWDFETNGSENWYGRNQSFGQLSIYSGRDSDGIVTAEASGVGYDGYDWTHIPGTTVPNLSLAEVLADAKNFQWPRFSNEAFASGVTDGKNGVYGFKFSDRTKGQSSSTWVKPKLTALKSYFFFDDLIVALGSNIDNTASSYDTHTTIFQNLLPSPNTPIQINGENITGLSYSQDLTTETPATLTDIAGNGYYIANAKGLHIQRSTQESMDDKNKNATSGNYATVWINHGSQINNGTYEYAVWVRGGEYISELASDPDKFYTVERQDNIAHIVTHGQTKGLTIFTENTDIEDKYIHQTSEPCLIWINSENEDISLTVANPDLGYYEKGNGFGQFSIQAWSVPASKQYLESEIEPVEVIINGKWNILDTNEKVENQGYNSVNNTTTLRFNGINAESLSVKLSPLNTGIDFSSKEKNISVYPNPTTSKLFIDLAEPTESNVRITDISGREVLSIPVNNRKNISIDLSTLNSGHYLVIIGKTVKQIIKK